MVLGFMGVECLGFGRRLCCVGGGGLCVLELFSKSKEFESGMGEVEKSELEKLGRPHLSQSHETLLPANPV